MIARQFIFPARDFSDLVFLNLLTLVDVLTFDVQHDQTIIPSYFNDRVEK